MSKHVVHILISGFICTVLLGCAVLNGSYFMNGFARMSSHVIEEAVGGFLIISALALWPWVVIFNRRNKVREYKRDSIFLNLSMLICLIFFFPIYNGHDFSIGLYTFFCILCLWIVFKLTNIKSG